MVAGLGHTWEEAGHENSVTAYDCHGLAAFAGLELLQLAVSFPC